MAPRILLPGKLTTNATGVRGDSYSNGLKYAEAVARAGGIVVTVAPLAEHIDKAADLVSAVEGVLLQGGGDIDPTRYGESRRSNTVYGIVEAHDDFEFAVVREAIRQDKPLLAICRG
ncbi:MAG: gamma-glutamyl-gamma-aminobutyrate hydrolase family protein, partial [Actinomycetota bacterium]